MDRPYWLAWWGTLAGLGALFFGLAVFFVYALSEVIANPGVSLVEGYWIGRLPWTGIGEGFTVMGATGAVVLGAATVWTGGSLWQRLVLLVPVVAAAFFWAVAMLPSPGGGPCNDCPPPSPDPFAYAYSLPENTVLFLFLPALLVAALAFTARQGPIRREPANVFVGTNTGAGDQVPDPVPDPVPPTDSGALPGVTRLAVAVVAPVGTVALAYAAWWISDRLLYIGPLDRAAFGWLVVVPIWMLAPMAAAYAWRTLTDRELTLAVLLVGLAIGIPAAALVWASSAFPDCQFGSVHAPADLIPGATFFGVVVGGGLAGICRATLSVLRRAQWWAALLLGAGLQFALVFVSIIPLAVLWAGPGCQRPF